MRSWSRLLQAPGSLHPCGLSVWPPSSPGIPGERGVGSRSSERGCVPPSAPCWLTGAPAQPRWAMGCGYRVVVLGRLPHWGQVGDRPTQTGLMPGCSLLCGCLRLYVGSVHLNKDSSPGPGPGPGGPSRTGHSSKGPPAE